MDERCVLATGTVRCSCTVYVRCTIKMSNAGRIILVIWRPTFKSPWVIITIPCCNLWALPHPNLQVIALRTPGHGWGQQKRSMEAPPQQATALEGHWRCMLQGITTLRRLCLILAAHHSPNPSMRLCAPQSIVDTPNDNASIQLDAILFP